MRNGRWRCVMNSLGCQTSVLRCYNNCPFHHDTAFSGFGTPSNLKNQGASCRYAVSITYPSTRFCNPRDYAHFAKFVVFGVHLTYFDISRPSTIYQIVVRFRDVLHSAHLFWNERNIFMRQISIKLVFLSYKYRWWSYVTFSKKIRKDDQSQFIRAQLTCSKHV